MKNKLLLLIIFLTFNTFANIGVIQNNIDELSESHSSVEITVLGKSNQGNHAILKKASLDEATLFQVAGFYPTCQQCRVELFQCKAQASNQAELGMCYQEYVDCREICTSGNPWDI